MFLVGCDLVLFVVRNPPGIVGQPDSQTKGLANVGTAML